MEIDISNKFMVGANAAGITLLNPPRARDLITPHDALVLAAYLVSLAEPQAGNSFQTVLEAVQEA